MDENIPGLIDIRFAPAVGKLVFYAPNVLKKEKLYQIKLVKTAEVEGFEPPVHLRIQQFSRLPHSTALAHLLHIRLDSCHALRNFIYYGYFFR